jgi:AraC-like DNA-binding protein
MRVSALAQKVGMSTSSLHHYFRAITGKSPLQYLKQMRLAEARRLLCEEKLDAATAGFRVGYNDASQFTREYRRSFGAPPMRDLRARRAELPGG